jgi:hypothetical protein
MAVTMKETRAPLRNIAQIIRRGQFTCASDPTTAAGSVIGSADIASSISAIGVMTADSTGIRIFTKGRIRQRNVPAKKTIRFNRKKVVFLITSR